MFFGIIGSLTIDRHLTGLVDVVGMLGAGQDNNAIIAAKAAADGEAYQAEVPFFDNQKVYEDLTDWMSKVPAVHQTKETPTITDTLKENLQTILDGKISIKEGMEEIQRSAENKIQ